MADLAGNTLDLARNIGQLQLTDLFQPSATYSDFVGVGDTHDYYRFSLESRGSITLSLNGLSANADLRLLDAGGDVIASSSTASSSYDSILLTLESGVYYVDVLSVGDNNTDYQLTAYNRTDSAGDTEASAKLIDPINPLTNSQISWESVDANDTDYYRFVLDTKTRLDLRLFSSTTDLNLNVFKEDGSSVASYINFSNDAHVDNIVDAGTYYLKLSAAIGGRYRLQTRAVPVSGFNTEYFNNPSLAGPATFTTLEGLINHDWGQGGPGRGIGNDGFSVRWSGAVDFDAGNYFFQAKADDGIRLWVDGNLAIDGWKDQAVRDYGANLVLSQGSHDIRVEYYENAGDAVAKVWWEKSSPTGQFNAEYFNNRDLAGNAVLTRTETSIDYDWGWGSPAPVVNVDNFSARWQGVFNFEEGTYLFHDRADDGIRMWVDDQLIIDQWNDQPASNFEATRYMTAGDHKVKVEYYENGIDATAKAWWEKVDTWTAEYFGNKDLAGQATWRETFNAPTQGFSKDWDYGAPVNTPTDNFSGRFTTTRWLDPGFYKIETVADDGIRVRFGEQTVIDRWVINGQFENTGFFRSTGEMVPISIDYFEQGGLAYLNFRIKEAPEPLNVFETEYFNNKSLAGKAALTTLETTIDHDWIGGGPGAGVGVDGFSGRWNGTFEFDAGSYFFRAKADDGIRVWVDDQLAIDGWQAQSVTDYGVNLNLTGGKHKVKVEYYEETGLATAKVWWEKSNPTGQFKAEYFNGRNLSVAPTVVRNETAINYDWGGGSPVAGVNADNFSARWTGIFRFDAANYLFRDRADDGIRMWIDDQLIIDKWNDQSATDFGAYRTMTAGDHKVQVEYYENGGEATAKAWWQKSSPWTAEYFANREFAGQPVAREIFGDESQGFSKNWGDGAPANVPVDQFSARFTTTSRWLDPGFYKIETMSDDGIRVRVGDRNVIDRMIDQSYSPNSGFFHTNGGEVPITIEYYENTGAAALAFNIKPVEKFEDNVDVGTNWRAMVFAIPVPGQDVPADFSQGEFNNPNVIGVVNLGSNTRGDGKKGFVADWGAGALNGDGARLPHDFYAVRAYTAADFDGSEYKFYVRGDDQFQIFAKKQGTNEWFYITPQNYFVQAYGAANEYKYTLPAGRYDVHFQFVEGGGNAYFDLSWEKVNNRIVPSYLPELADFSDEKWDIQSGDDNQFRSNSPFGGGDQRFKTDDRIRSVYTDLSTAILGYRAIMTTGYAFDTSYYNYRDMNNKSYGAHSGIDIATTDYQSEIKSPINGRVVKSLYDSGNGYWVAVDELDSLGQKVGRRWWFGHLSNPVVGQGSIVKAGETLIAKAGNQGHLHLNVTSISSSAVDFSEAFNGKWQGSYQRDVNWVLQRTVSPLQAYWQYRNTP